MTDEDKSPDAQSAAARSEFMRALRAEGLAGTDGKIYSEAEIRYIVKTAVEGRQVISKPSGHTPQ